MDTKKEDIDVKTVPEAPAMPAPGEPGPGPSAVPSPPLHGPVDVAEIRWKNSSRPSGPSQSRRWSLIL